MRQKKLPLAIREGKTPEVWCKILKENNGIQVSARTLRAAARKSGNYLAFGQKILLLPEHIDSISENL